MADALCGPSNALQNFQKHTTIDRTLQQDRLISRQSPSQGFRSVPSQNAGILDPEFEAFQAGHSGPPQPDFHHLPPHLSQATPPPQFATPPLQVAGWASDFQRLHISSPPPSTLQQNQHFRPQASASSWHQDFLKQQAPVTGLQTYQSPAQNMFGGMNGYSMGGYAAQSFNQPQFGVPMHSQDMSVAQGKQRAQEDTSQFDEAAFERAFEQAQAEILAEQGPISLGQSVAEGQSASLPRETDPILLRIAEKRYPVYLSIKLQSLIQLKPEDALIYLQELENLEANGSLFNDLSEARWCLGALKNVLDADVAADTKSRSNSLIEKINARLMSMYPVNAPSVPINERTIWDDLNDAGYTLEAPHQEPMQEEPQQEKKEQDQHPNDDDEMAETAARLLDSVADNTSEKFRQSTFLELMRRLRDREVRVEGDKMVETNSTAKPALLAPDPLILDEYEQGGPFDFLDPPAAPSPLTLDECEQGGPYDYLNPQTAPNSLILDEYQPQTARIPPHEQDADLGRDPIETMHGHEPDFEFDRYYPPLPLVDKGTSYVNGCLFRRGGQLI